MSVLAKIRSRAGLLVAVIGMALFAFILGDIFTSGRSIFSGKETNVGVIGGQEVSIYEFDKKVEDQLEQIKKSNPNAPAPDESKKDQIVQTTWQQTISEKIFNKEFDRLGISVSSDELADQMLGKDPNPVMSQFFSDQQTGQVLRQYARPDGRLNVQEVRKYVANMNEEAEKNWVSLEKYIRENRKQAKYMDLIKKGLYITTAQARHDSSDAASIYGIRYIAKKYNATSDSALKVTDEDRLSWYNTHQYKFKVKEAARSIEYVAFDIAPSRRDNDERKAEMKALVDEFKTKTGKEDTSFVLAESDVRAYTPHYAKKGVLAPAVDSIISKGVAGTVAGPVEERGRLVLYKVLGSKFSSDSAKVRHLLIAYKGSARADSSIRRTKVQAKHLADSLLTVVKSKKKKLEDLVNKYTDDPGSKDTPDGKPGNRGDYGWMTEESGFVQAFKDAGLKGKKGDVSIVETEFGYHIIEVLDKTKDSYKVQYVTIERQEIPSKATIDSVYLMANTFAGKNTSSELFSKAVEKAGMNKLIAGDIKATDHQIRGLESPKELVRWMYADERKKGDVSQPFQLGERFVIASLTSIKEKGVAPLEEVKDKVDAEVKKQKKADKFIEQFTAAEAGTGKIEDLASKMREPSQVAENLSFVNTFIPGLGQENEVVGTMAAMKENTLSKPIQGNSGVFVIMIDKVTKGAAQDAKSLKKQNLAGLQGRADGEAFEALKENAKIKDNRAKFY
jgi:peptidyl-prolyl cis-trans isomerase D